MLINQTLDKLDALGLFGMALGLREQLEAASTSSLSFDERFGLLVDREAEARDSRRLALRLKAAKLRQEATVEDHRLPRAAWTRSIGDHEPGPGRLGGRPPQPADHRTDRRRQIIPRPARWRTPRSAVATRRCTCARRGLLAELALSRGDGRYVRRLGATGQDRRCSSSTIFC